MPAVTWRDGVFLILGIVWGLVVANEYWIRRSVDELGRNLQP